MPEQDVYMSKPWESESMPRKNNGKPPRRDEEAMKAMAERPVRRSEKEEIGMQAIMEILKSTSMDWELLGHHVMHDVEKAVKKDVEKEEHQNRERSYLRNFNNLDIEEIE